MTFQKKNIACHQPLVLLEYVTMDTSLYTQYGRLPVVQLHTDL